MNTAMTVPNSTRAFRSQYMAGLSRRRRRWLAVLGCTCSALAVLSGCDAPRQSAQAPQTEQVLVYKSLDECKANVADPAICDQALAEARKWQDEQPAYSDKQRCETEYGVGNCETRSTGAGNLFVPVMMGFMMSNAMNRMSYNSYMQRRNEPGFGGGGAYPVHINRDGNVSTYSGSGSQPLGQRVPMGPGGRATLPSSFEVMKNPAGQGYVAPGSYARSPYTSQSRGGFGGSSSFRGGCCG